jgi:hypothetical protein
MASLLLLVTMEPLNSAYVSSLLSSVQRIAYVCCSYILWPTLAAYCTVLRCLTVPLRRRMQQAAFAHCITLNDTLLLSSNIGCYTQYTHVHTQLNVAKLLLLQMVYLDHSSVAVAVAQLSVIKLLRHVHAS